MNKFQTVNDVTAYMEEIAPLKFDSVMEMSELSTLAHSEVIGIDDDGNPIHKNDVHLAVPQTPIEQMYRGSTTLPMSRSAFRNLMYRAGMANGWKFLRDSATPRFPGETSDLINGLIGHKDFNTNKRGPKKVMVRSRGKIESIEGDEAMHRALFSNQYSILDMLAVSRIVQQHTDNFAQMGDMGELMQGMKNKFGVDVTITGQGGSGHGIGHTLERVHVTPDEMSFRVKLGITFHTEEMGDFNTGLYVGTDEIGVRSVHLLSYIWRQVCSNGMVASYERKEITDMRQNEKWAPIIYHRWDDSAGLEYQAHKAIKYALMAGSELVVKAREAAIHALPDTNDILSQMLLNVLPKDQKDEGLMVGSVGMEGHKSVMGLVNGVTSVAHMDGLNQGTVDELESLGGTMLRRYDSEMSDAEVKNLFLGLAKVELIQTENEA